MYVFKDNNGTFINTCYQFTL